MRSFILAAPVVLAACATNPGTPVHGVTPGHRCEVAEASAFIGQQGTSENGAAIMAATRAAVLRWAPPGAMLTMDFREDRVTVRLGPDGKITAINCG